MLSVSNTQHETKYKRIAIRRQHDGPSGVILPMHHNRAATQCRPSEPLGVTQHHNHHDHEHQYLLQTLLLKLI